MFTPPQTFQWYQREAHKTAVVPRVSDLPYLAASTSGKIEFETVEEDRNQSLIEKLVDKAVLNTFNRYFQVQQFDAFLSRFKSGWSLEVSE